MVGLEFLAKNKKLLQGKEAKDYTLSFAKFKSANSTIGVEQFQKPHKNFVLKAKKTIPHANELLIVNVLKAQLLKTPNIVANIQNSYKKGIESLQKELGNSGYALDLKKAYNTSLNNQKLIPHFLTFVAKSIITPYIKKGIATKRAGQNRDSIISMISESQTKTFMFKEIAKHAGKFGLKPCITRFSKNTINALATHTGYTYNDLVRDFEINAFIKANDLRDTTPHTLQTYSDDELANALVDNIITKDDIKDNVESSRHANISKKAQRLMQF